MSGKLAGKVAFVSAAGGGIAGAIARRFADDGASVWCVDVNEAAVNATVEEINATHPDRGAASAGDAANEAFVKKSFDDLIARFGRLDIIVNAAATGGDLANVVEMAFAQWEKELSVNLSSVFLGCKYGIPHMINSGGGSVINIASTFGSVAVPGRPGYLATKGAIKQLTKSVAIDFAAHNIRANSISPGAIETNRLLERHPSMDVVREKYIPRHPIGRLGQPHEIAAAAAFLASDDASFMTGSDMFVDGGYTSI